MTEGLKGRHVKIVFADRESVSGFVKEAECSLMLITPRANDDRKERFVKGDLLVSLDSGAFVQLEVL